VLDLALVRRFGGLDGLQARVPRPSAVGAWIAVATQPPASAGADEAEAVLPAATPTSFPGVLIALLGAGRLEQADAIWTGTADAARARGELETLRLAVALRAQVRMRQGRVAEVEADLRELIAWVGELELPYAELRMSLPWVVAPLVDALIERDELDEAEHWVTVTDLAAKWPEVFGFTFLLDSLARLRLAQGRVAEALGLARECGRRQRAWGIRNPGFLPWGSTLAAALHATGRTTEALDLCDQQIDLARAFGVPREHGMGLLSLGTITGEVATLRRAVDVLRDSPARLELARALTALGGRDALREALDIAERCGATALAARAREALVATGARPRRARLTDLTAAQERVARLAADGLGNRQIAEALWVTEKTVEGHLGAAYRKLGIGSRSQLGEALRTIPADPA
jgi:DNA-binding CsgD family transcriptional regulator